MAISNFIPEYWATQVEGKLRAALVYGQPGITNHNYEGEIRQAGDTVRISQYGEVSIFDYVRNQDMPDPEELSDSQKTLVIDQQKAFNFQVDDVDAAQATESAMPAAMESAAYGLAEDVDLHLAGQMVAGAGIVIDPADLAAGGSFYKDVALPARTACARANLPAMGRFMILPPEVVAYALDDDRVLQATDYQPVLNGEIGRCAGFRLLESNNVPVHGNDEDGDSATDPTAGYYKISFGISQATSMANQVNSVEAYRMEKRFADAVKGLHVYGSKVLHSDRLGLIEVNA